MAGGRSKGGHCAFRFSDRRFDIVICEGYATAATVFAACGYPAVVIAFNCGNLADVGQAMRERYRQARIMFGPTTTRPPWQSRRLKSDGGSLAIGAVVAVPPRPGDFNDLAADYGLEAVRLSFAALFDTGQGRARGTGRAGAEPDEAVFARLARLSEVQYDRVRAAEAKKLGIKVSTLDEEVRKRRKRLKRAPRRHRGGRRSLADWRSPPTTS